MKKTILLGVSASVSAYKAVDITSQLRKLDYEVHVVMTEHAKAIIPSLTLQTLSKNYVHTDVMAEHKPELINHIELAKMADLFIIAPATANIIGKIANGIADDMLSTVAIAVHDIPKLIAPAMNTYMYENPAVQDNLKKLESYGYSIIEPKESMLACGDFGKGALADWQDVLSIITEQLKH